MIDFVVLNRLRTFLPFTTSITTSTARTICIPLTTSLSPDCYHYCSHATLDCTNTGDINDRIGRSGQKLQRVNWQ